jgi:hypothetical protein
MCELCDEVRGLQEKDRNLLEWGGETFVNLRHGVRVQMNVWRFKADEKEYPQHREMTNRVVPKSGPQFFDLSYVYTPYIPVH